MHLPSKFKLSSLASWIAGPLSTLRFFHYFENNFGLDYILKFGICFLNKLQLVYALHD